MVSGAGMTCVKILMIVFNFIFWIAGLALIVVGSIAQNASTKIHSVNPSAVFIIVIGVIIFILAFLGCCGAWKENRCMLITFGILMLVILILCVAAVIVAFVFKAQVKQLYVGALLQTLKDARNTSADNALWEQLQKSNECCGVNNYTDWIIYSSYTQTNLPSSCCSDGHTPCSATPPSKQMTTGCANAFFTTVEHQAAIVGGITAGVAVLMILGVVFAFCLAQAIHNDYKVV